MTFSEIVVVSDQLGLHARPAAQIAILLKETKLVHADVVVEFAHAEGRVADASSALRLMALRAKPGEQLEITVEGVSENVARDILTRIKEFLAE
jgi:phosphotransferase system HPr (HPr) family protein